VTDWALTNGDGAITGRGPRVALGGAIGAILLLGASGPLYQLELLPLAAAYGGVVLAAVIGVGLLLWSLHFLVAAKGGSRHRLKAVITAGLTTFTIVVPVHDRLRARAAPALHDVTTDLHDPPTFKTLSDVEAPEKLVRSPQTDAVQSRAYPDVRPLTLPVPTDEAFEEVLETFAELDWPVTDGNQDDGLIEGTIRSPWFGFRDDIVVRLAPEADGQTRVDVRSIARDGRNDGGRNAEHVKDFIEELQR